MELKARDIFARYTARQKSFYGELPKAEQAKLAQLQNKYAELRVLGPQVPQVETLYFQYQNQSLRLLEESERPNVPYEEMDKFILQGDGLNYYDGLAVLIDVIDGELPPRKAKDMELFRTHTSTNIYDSEQFIQAFERFLREMQKVLGRVKR